MTGETTMMGTMHEDRLWWQDAVVYQVYPRSFADADGDGIGDLAGIMSKLDYLRALGVDAVWMSPCFPSPQHDHGYDVSDYFDINPDYGDLEVFDRLVAEARQRGIRIMLDVVPNHCSRDHAWFREALRAGRGSAQRERFYFRDGRGPHGDEPPNNWTSIFGGPAWTRTTEPDGSPGQWYLHVFDSSQPDFNWDHAEVKKHFDDVLTFWFDRGVEGFRVDAVTVVAKAPGLPDAPPPRSGRAQADLAAHNPHFQLRDEAHHYWRRWRGLIDRYERDHPGRHLVTVSEAYTGGQPQRLLKFVEPDQFHQSFCFDLMLAPWVAPLIRKSIADNYAVLSSAGAHCSWTLNNHDTHRAVTRYGRANADDEASYTGNNLLYVNAPVDVEVGTRRAVAMFALTAGLPGALYVYQGEELGLPEWLDMPDDRREDPVFFRTSGAEKGRDGCRVPLPWTTDPSTSFGFSAVSPAAPPWLPQPPWWGTHAAQSQEGNAGSTLQQYRDILAARRSIDVHAGLEWVLDEHRDLVAFRRGDTLVVMNTGGESVVLPDDVVGAARPVLSTDGTSGRSVAPDATVWFRSPSASRTVVV